MKKLQAFKMFAKTGFIAAALFLTACSDDDNGGGGTPAGFHLKAKVGGANYSNSDLFEPMAVLTNNVLMIQSSDNNGDAIQIQITNFDGVGTYESGNNNLLNGYINYMDMGATIGQFTSYTSVRGDGIVEITEITDTEVKGTFSATVFENVDGSTNSIEITDGTFRAAIE